MTFLRNMTPLSVQLVSGAEPGRLFLVGFPGENAAYSAWAGIDKFRSELLLSEGKMKASWDIMMRDSSPATYILG